MFKSHEILNEIKPVFIKQGLKATDVVTVERMGELLSDSLCAFFNSQLFIRRIDQAIAQRVSDNSSQRF